MSKYSKNKPPALTDAISWMLEFIEEDKDLLDFGCSTGYFGALIRQMKHGRVFGVEISGDKKEAKKVLDGVYSFDLDADWPEIVYERKYDYLFFGDVLEHLKDPGVVLKKCKALLKTNGLIFISTPNIAHISIRLELLTGNFDYEPMGILDDTHLKYFTKKGLIKMIEEADYHIEHYTFTANDYPNAIIKKILDKCGLKATDKFWKIIDTPEARAFQHKVVIAPDLSVKKVKNLTRYEEKPEQIRNAKFKDLENQVKNLKEHAREQAKIIEHYVNENKELKRTRLNKVARKIRRNKIK